MTKLNIQYRDPVSLSIHPALRHIPALDEEQLRPIRAGMKYGADSLQPIPVDDEGRILSDSGRTAWLCAKARQLKEVPVVISASGADVHLIIIRDLACRRHLSKSAIAYLAVPHLQPALDAATAQRLDNLRKGQEIPETALSAYSGAATRVELAEELGIGVRMLDMAIEVHKAFEDKKIYSFNLIGAQDGAVSELTLKAWFEPKLLQAFIGGEHEQNRPMGLGGILAGITAVREGDKSKFAPKPRQTDFFGDLFSDQIQKFTAMPEAKRVAAMAIMQKSAEDMEPEECEQAASTLKAMAKIYSDAAKAKARA